MKPTMIVFLIVAVLACPFRCMGVFGSACLHKTNESESPGCACCCEANSSSDTNNESVPSDEKTPEKDCGCQDCLCSGALIEPRIAYSDSMDGIGTDFHFVLTHWSTRCIDGEILVLEVPARVIPISPRDGVGFRQRIAYQSLQI